MGFFSRLFSGRNKGDKPKGKKGYTVLDRSNGLWVFLQCDRCGEKIPVRLRVTSELQRREGPDEDLGPGQFFVRKVIVGENCYERIEATIDFDRRYNVVSSEIINGKLITQAEYKQKDEH